MDGRKVLARNGDVRIERQHEFVPARGDCVIALHEIARGDIAQTVRARVRRAGRVRIEGMGRDQMRERAEFIAGVAACIGKRAVNRCIERRDRAQTINRRRRMLGGVRRVLGSSWPGRAHRDAPSMRVLQHSGLARHSGYRHACRDYENLRAGRTALRHGSIALTMICASVSRSIRFNTGCMAAKSAGVHTCLPKFAFKWRSA